MASTVEYIIINRQQVKADSLTLGRIKGLLPSLREEALEIYGLICVALNGRAMCRFSQVLRTIKEQDDLFAQGRTKPGVKITNAKGGQSYHNYGMAIDVVLVIDGKTVSWDFTADYDKDLIADLVEVVQIFKKHGWAWGGDFKSFVDKPHFEKTFGYKTSQLFSMPKDKEGYPVF